MRGGARCVLQGPLLPTGREFPALPHEAIMARGERTPVGSVIRMQDRDALVVFDCRADVVTLTHQVGQGRDLRTRSVALGLRATPALMAVKEPDGTDDWQEFILEPETAEQLAAAMLDRVRQIRRQAEP
jgi:hypothetical protein